MSGPTGVSGAVSVLTGTASAGSSGGISLATGQSEGGAGGAIALTVGEGDTGAVARADDGVAVVARGGCANASP